MSILKKILILISGVVALVLILALFVTKELAVQKELIINKSCAEVFDYVKLLKNQDHYSVWAQMDPSMQKNYTGTDGNIGFVSAWDSQIKDVGKGEQEIKKIIPGERIDFELRFLKPFESTDDAYMITEALSEGQTKVIWGFKGKMPYPMNLMLVFMNMEEDLGTDLQRGLQNLKVILEK